MGSCQTVLMLCPCGTKPFQTLSLIELKESISELAYVYKLLDACNTSRTCVNFSQCKYFNS